MPIVQNSVNADIAGEIALEQDHGIAGQWTTSRTGLVGQITVASELHLTSWVAPRTTPVTSITTYCTVASATITLQRMGLYTVDSTGLTLVASTAHDAALWQAVQAYTKNVTETGVVLQAGQRYALGVLFVGTTAPTLVCNGDAGVNAALKGAINYTEPWLVARVATQTVLPTTVTAANVVASTSATGRILARIA